MTLEMSNFLQSFNFSHCFRESEEMEKRSKEDLEEKRREISELSSDLAAARWGLFCALFKAVFETTFSCWSGS